MQIDIDYSIYKDHLSLKKSNGKTMILDPIRKKYLVLQPEELVRQLVVQYLLHDRKYNKNRIGVERGLLVNELKKRCLGSKSKRSGNDGNNNDDLVLSSGVMVKSVAPTAPCRDVLLPNDVVCEIDGIGIANDGKVPFRPGERIGRTA